MEIRARRATSQALNLPGAEYRCTVTHFAARQDRGSEFLHAAATLTACLGRVRAYGSATSSPDYKTAVGGFV